MQRAKELIKAGVDFEKSGDYRTSIEKFRSGLSLNPNQPEWVFSKFGKVCMLAKDLNLAIETFTRQVELFPDSSNGYAGLAKASMNEKNWSEAVKHWDDCLNRSDAPSIDWLAKAARSYFSDNQFVKAGKLYLDLIEQESDKDRGYWGLVKLHQKTGDVKSEIKWLKILLEKFPESPNAKTAYGHALLKTGEYEDAENWFQQLVDQNPNDIQILLGLARAAKDTRNYELASSRYGDLAERFPDLENLKILYVQALLDVIDFETAQDFYDSNLTSNSSMGYLYLQVKIYWTQQENSKALDALYALKSKYPDNVHFIRSQMRLLIEQFKYTGDSTFLEQAMDELTLLNGLNFDKHELLADLIKLNILSNKKDEALELISQINEDRLGRQDLDFKTWAAYAQGNIDGAKKLWKKIESHHSIPQIQTVKSGILKKTDSNSINIESDSVLLFTAIRNERWRLPWFLEYYRSIGVQKFFFVDNNSDDGTSEFLHEQKDVYVFWTDQSYARSYSGMQWINSLVALYGDNCWCLYIDVDEALIFSGIEERGLGSLLNYLTDKGQEAVSGFMLDMFAPGLESAEKGENYMDFAVDYPYFENEYKRSNSIHCPYVYTTGGVRKVFAFNENLTKTPIIRGGKGINFLMSSHLISPAVLSDVTVALLHYKLAGNFKQIFIDDLTSNTRMSYCRIRHWSYVQVLDNNSVDESFVNEKTVNYESSRQLLELGLIETSEDFENKKY